VSEMKNCPSFHKPRMNVYCEPTMPCSEMKAFREVQVRSDYRRTGTPTASLQLMLVSSAKFATANNDKTKMGKLTINIVVRLFQELPLCGRRWTWISVGLDWGDTGTPLDETTPGWGRCLRVGAIRCVWGLHRVWGWRRGAGFKGVDADGRQRWQWFA
jgi:hypothetical protein